MVRNSTKKATTTPLTAAAAATSTSSPATSPSATPTPTRAALSPNSPPTQASNAASAAAAASQSSEKLNSKNAATSDNNNNNSNNAKRLKETPVAAPSQTPGEKPGTGGNETSPDASSSKQATTGLGGITANEAASEEPRIKQFDCKSCGRKVKMDANIPESAHTCVPSFVVLRPRTRLRGPPPYQYLSEEGLTISRAATRRGAKKSGGAVDDKRKPDPEREAWLRSEVMNKVYDKDALWCRYCGCEQASGWSRGPWGPKKLCTIHYVQWFKKKALDLSKYPEEPTEPINRMENTEYDYMKRMQLKNKKEDESE